jgi:cyclophilin family peptidyl-prolyl cis-trans isomerase
MAELQRAQQRRRTGRRALVAGVIVVIAVVLALVTGGVFSSSPKKNVSATGTGTTVPASTTIPPSTTTASGGTTTPASPTTTVAPLSAAALDAALVARQPPAVSPDCNVKPSAAITKGNKPASGNAVAIIHAPAKVPFPNLDGSSPHYTAFSSAPPFCIDVNKTYTATVTTDVGVITIQLLPKYAPLTVNNFVFLAGYHYYDGLVYHRVIQGFMDQTGDPLGTGAGGPGYQFKDELPKSAAAYDNGAIAMANSGPNTNGSQMFMVVNGGGAELSPNYTMFGQITSGLDVAAKINAAGSAPTDQNGTPTTMHKILSVKITSS